MKKILFNYLRSIASPGYISEKSAIITSHIAILLLCAINLMIGPQISLQILYVFPLTVIALHSSRDSFVMGALLLSITLQLLNLISFDDQSWINKTYLALIITLSNSIFTLVARFTRTHTLEVNRLSTIDPLTQLYNRRAFDVAMNTEILRQHRYGSYFSLALIDLDGFKNLNDTMGHQAGDRALVLLADILRKNTRQSDTIARIGGDEFVILMPSAHAEECEACCHMLCHKISHSMAELAFPITASIGYTTIEHPIEFTTDILIIADRAMYQAKSTGKGRIVRGDALFDTPDQTVDFLHNRSDRSPVGFGALLKSTAATGVYLKPDFPLNRYHSVVRPMEYKV